MHVPKPLIVVIVAALGLLGIGVATAAVGDGEDDRGLAPGEPTTAPSTTTPSTTTPSTTTPSTTTLPTTTAPTTAPVEDGGDDADEPDDGQAVDRYYGPECGEEIPGGTHGDYVSRAAHAGADVSVVAHSDCGKPLSSVHGSSPEPEVDEPKEHPQGGPRGQSKDKGRPPKS